MCRPVEIGYGRAHVEVKTEKKGCRMTSDGAMPLIVTARMPQDTQSVFDHLRRTHFPPERNFLSAHLTLYHALPGAEQQSVEAVLAEEAAHTPPPEVQVAGLRFLGRGVAYGLDSQGLGALRARLSRAFAAFLTAQDQQGFRPHVTVQNKVEPSVARALEARLLAAPLPPPFALEGLELWRYRGGPWDAIRFFPFTGETAEAEA